MNSMTPPPGDALDPTPIHPDLPKQGEDEDYIQYLGRVSDWMTETPPPAPYGFELVPCHATPRHFPEYRIADDVFHESECVQCHHQVTSRALAEARCQLKHRRWKSWNVWYRLASWAYVAGLTASGGGTSYGRCEFCGIGRQHMRPRVRGKRSYVLGIQRERWTCLKRGHRFRLHHPSGLCVICCPCPECGSTEQDHYTCEVPA